MMQVLEFNPKESELKRSESVLYLDIYMQLRRRRWWWVGWGEAIKRTAVTSRLLTGLQPGS